ncbi:hypothetical protein GCM10022225_57780 [Plantactinospora mayteni]|uniref:Uncharacterized protein n=1 Tax=Plantactinospora mayteni TaxID=566021 RepID=A0ABQ4F1M7_9ACTN|nr:hypothetical protein Pma05_73890 [Plantactinospora mayteni]
MLLRAGAAPTVVTTAINRTDTESTANDREHPMLWQASSRAWRQQPYASAGYAMPGRPVHLSAGECAELGGWRT